RLNASPTCD
ncbi:hypothetical protein BN1723_016254, partial [Verticillium longisporum]